MKKKEELFDNDDDDIDDMVDKSLNSWKDYRQELQDKWNEIVKLKTTSSEGIANSGDNSCWFPPEDSKRKFSLELNKHGYYRLRFQMQKEEPKIIRSARKKRKSKEYYRNEDGSTKLFSRSRYPRGTIYLTHLAYLQSHDEIERYKKLEYPDGQFRKVWFTISHVCNNRKCFNPNHIVLEPQQINLSRIKCCYENCQHHHPKCLQTLTRVQDEIKYLYSLMKPIL